ncbi:MAG: hypothetical protein Q4Q06_00035 [Bacteroidota bacterium]|nr:hypothetical protein [Bacteroidota bacterium]
MKRFLVMTMMVVIIAISGYSQESNVKRHNFGIGISSSLSSSTNKFLKHIGNNTFEGNFGKIDKNFDLNLSFLYEYNVSKNITIGVAPTYRESRAEINYQYESSLFGETTETIYDIEVPLFVDYKFSVMEKNKLFAGVGFSGLFNINTDSEEIATKNTFSPYMLFRLGFDVYGKHRIQFLMQYRCNLSANTYYNGIDYNMFPHIQKEYFKVNTFDVGVNFFF